MDSHFGHRIHLPVNKRGGVEAWSQLWHKSSWANTRHVFSSFIEIWVHSSLILSSNTEADIFLKTIIICFKDTIRCMVALLHVYWPYTISILVYQLCNSLCYGFKFDRNIWDDSGFISLALVPPEVLFASVCALFESALCLPCCSRQDAVAPVTKDFDQVSTLI